MKRFLISAVAALVMSFGLAGLAPGAHAGTIDFTHAHFAQPGGQGAGDDSDWTNNSPNGFSAFHKFGSYNDTFVDTYDFTVKDLSELVFDVTTINHVIKLTFTLINDDTHMTVLKTSGFTGKFGETHDQEMDLFSGGLLDLTLAHLTLKITGIMCACAEYKIAVSGIGAPTVPVPPALLLFMTAVVGIGGVGAMRRNSSSPAGTAA